MAGLLKLPACNGDGDAYVVVETPRGSAAKLEYDPDLHAFTLSKALILGLTYPYDWGFIPSTKGEEGDPLDADPPGRPASEAPSPRTATIVAPSASSTTAVSR